MADDSAHVTTADGRILTYLEVGDAGGPLVIHNHGGPSSRLEATLFGTTAQRLGLRLVCPDRPGMGGSSPHPGRTFADWAADTTAIADALGQHEFGVTGWSEGGPWALAAAAYVDPARLRHVTNIAGGCYGTFGDNWAADHLSKADALGGTLALRFKPAFHLMYSAIGFSAKHFRGSFAKQLRASVNDYDRRVLSEPGVEDVMLDAFAECFAQSSDGLVADAELLYHGWSFDVTTIERPIHFWQGTDDHLVPAYLNETIANRTPGSVWHGVEGAGHFIAVGAADEIFAVTAGNSVPRTWWPRSLAGQAIALQVLVIAVVVAAGSGLALFDARRDGDAAARQQVVSIATALADAPSTASAIESHRATEILQPVTEAVRTDTDIAFITIMAPDGLRFTHTDPKQIGGLYLGTKEPALRGETYTEVYTGTLGPSVRAIVPVRSADGRVVGMVAAGITQQTLAQRWREQVPAIVVVGLGALALSFVGVWAIRRRLLRQTHGLRPDELRVMYEHHDAILHSVSEGLIVLDRNRVVLVNDEARRLLGLPPGTVRPEDLPEFLRSYEPGVRDELHVTDDRVLVVNRSEVEGRGSGGQERSDRGMFRSEVVTIRDRTELQGALGELSSLQVLTDSLRAQAHEAANKLHTVITMVEMGRPEDAVVFATEELALSQQLVDRLSDDVGEPALVALLLGKTAQADERGIALTVTEDTHLPSTTDGVPLTPQEIVTVLGNLVDNAMDACDRDDPWVEVTVSLDDAGLLMRVADSGAGMDSDTFARAMQRGYSTKSDTDAEQHGLGLALVAQVVQRHGGELTADVTYGSVVTVTVPRAVST